MAKANPFEECFAICAGAFSLFQDKLRMSRPEWRALAQPEQNLKNVDFPTTTDPTTRESFMIQANRDFYDPLWLDSELIPANRFNTWSFLGPLSEQCSRRLEVGPGLRPRLPLKGTSFVDLSAPAVTKLNASGADATLGLISALPFPDSSFDLVCALDIIEHVDDDESAMRELSRVAAPNAVLIISVPLHPDRWTDFDHQCGHRRRYEPEAFFNKLRDHGFTIERSAGYGMQPKSSRLVELGMDLMKHYRKRAMWYYNHIFMPIGLFFQPKFVTQAGVADTESLDQILLICRKASPAKSSL